VLGAAGFIGRNTCAALLAAGWSVTAVVRRDTDSVPGCRHERLDLLRSDPGTVRAALETARPQLVVNATGAVWGATDEDLTEGNVTLVRRLVDAVAALPESARLIHMGTAYEYGEHPGETVLSEALQGRPASRYAQTKLAGTQTVAGASREGRIDGTVLRIPLTVGPFASPRSFLGGLAHQLAARPREITLPPV
jgi:nucleoside-diphosphate-sugar epimerase